MKNIRMHTEYELKTPLQVTIRKGDPVEILHVLLVAIDELATDIGYMPTDLVYIKSKVEEIKLRELERVELKYWVPVLLDDFYDYCDDNCIWLGF